MVILLEEQGRGSFGRTPWLRFVICASESLIAACHVACVKVERLSQINAGLQKNRMRIGAHEDYSFRVRGDGGKRKQLA
jgi:hypothetical protein